MGRPPYLYEDDDDAKMLPESDVALFVHQLKNFDEYEEHLERVRNGCPLVSTNPVKHGIQRGVVIRRQILPKCSRYNPL